MYKCKRLRQERKVNNSAMFLALETVAMATGILSKSEEQQCDLRKQTKCLLVLSKFWLAAIFRLICVHFTSKMSS